MHIFGTFRNVQVCKLSRFHFVRVQDIVTLRYILICKIVNNSANINIDDMTSVFL